MGYAKIYLFLIAGVFLSTNVGCSTITKQRALVKISPSEVEQGQIIRLVTKEEIFVDVYSETESEIASKLKTDLLIIEVTNKDSSGVKGILVEAYDPSTNLYVVNENRSHIFEFKLQDINYIQVWGSKLVRNTSQELSTEDYAEIFGWIFAITFWIAVL